MAENSRIEDLRKRYHENPKRFFAPLANEYRKAGFLDRALLLCQKHVPEQPENMNGLVVFGQTLFESGNTAEAQEPFERALKLDPENLIALRHLGDIARLGGDVPTAKQWYERVLELDRRNDEVLDLLQEMGVADAPEEAPAARPSTTAGGLVSVASSVSVSGVGDLGMIDLGEPAAPPAKPSTPVKTVVINAQALADRDRREAEGSASVTKPVPAVAAVPSPPATPAVAAPAAAAPSAKPAKRASLLDIDFDFSETGEPTAKPAAPVVPAAPVMGAEAAEYGFADVSGAETLAIEPPMAASQPIGLEPTSSADALMIETTGDVAPLGLEPTIAEQPSAAPPPLPGGDFELAEFSSDVAPLAGLEATEFTSEQVAPMAELENEGTSASMSTVPPLPGLDRPDVEPTSVEPLSGLADLPLLDEPVSAAAPVVDVPLLSEAEEPAAPSVDIPLLEEPIAEEPSSRPKPRMTKADLSSLPLLADFGLEDDEPVSSKPTPIITPAVKAAAEPSSAPPPIVEPASAPRASKATPAFVTETMAALYVKQGHIGEAIGVYRQLVAQSPNDSGLRAKLAELERMQAAEAMPAAAAPDVDMPDFDEPVDAAEPEPAAANAAMSGLSFGGIGLQGQGSAAPIAAASAPAGPSARDFFAGFARRAVAAAAVVAATVTSDAEAQSEPETSIPQATSQWPLDALFGAAQDVRDLHAAEVLAGVGSFEGPDGGSGLSTLFARVSEPAKRAVPRASEMLKFDQFFQAPGTGGSAAPPTPAADAPAGADDDLDQFHGWLKGLKK